MVDVETLRRLALALPEVVEASQGDRLVFEIAGQDGSADKRKAKGIAWSRLHRPELSSKRVPDPESVVIRCLIERKALLIEAAPDRFFDDDHHRGYPALLVRLALVEPDELAHLLYEAWRMQAPKALQARHTL